MSSERTAISPDQLATLESLWDRGMTSKGNKCSSLIVEAVSKSGLNEKVVKDWIGNTSRKKNGRQYISQKGFYTKGVSGYNLFVKKNKDKFSSIADWAAQWKGLPQEDKKCYIDEARQLPKGALLEELEKARQMLLKKLADLVQELHKVGVSLACLGYVENEQLELGAGKALQFFKERPHIHMEMFAYCLKGTDISNKMDVKELRSQVQDHLNNLYSKAVGKQQKFPYKKVAAGQIKVMGLPEDVLPLQLPSHYGERRLKEFLKCQEIKVQNMDAAVHTVNPVSEYSGITQEPTDSLVLTEFKNSAVSHTILPALDNISPTIHNFIQSTPFEITPASRTISLPVQATSRFIFTAPQSKHESTMTQATYMESIKTISDNQVEQAENHSPSTEIKANHGHPTPASRTISLPVQATSRFIFTAPQSTHESTMTQATYMESIKTITDNQVEQAENHSPMTEIKANPGHPDVCLKRKLEHKNAGVYSVKAILAQRKRRGIQRYLVEWEGYTREEATWEPKRNIPEEIINSLWKI